MKYSTRNLQDEQMQSAKLIQGWLTNTIAEQLQVAPEQIDIRAPFDGYGLSSAQTLIIVANAEKEFGLRLSPILLWHYPSIESLSHRLAEEFSTSEHIFEL